MHALGNDATACRQSVHDQIAGNDVVMIDPAVDRRISKVLARMSVRAREPRHSTGLGQDKSRSLRRELLSADGRKISDLSRGAL
jgi:hypothetical protein